MLQVVGRNVSALRSEGEFGADWSIPGAKMLPIGRRLRKCPGTDPLRCPHQFKSASEIGPPFRPDSISTHRAGETGSLAVRRGDLRVFSCISALRFSAPWNCVYSLTVANVLTGCSRLP